MRTTLIAITLFSFAMIGCKTSTKENPHHLQAPIADENSSKKTLDWDGTYAGTIPCADCSGIKTKITLHQDLTYTKSIKYLGKENTATSTNGTFTWNDLENTITIKETSYMVGKNTLIQLNKEKENIKGALATQYVLQKIAVDTNLTDVKWQLIELAGQKVNQTDKNIPFLSLNSTENTLTGFSGCNNFSGDFTLKFGNRVNFSKIAATRKYCENTPYEAEFLKVLGTIDNYTINNNTLSLNKARMAPLAKFKIIP